jgi:hypothetical protein
MLLRDGILLFMERMDRNCVRYVIVDGDEDEVGLFSILCGQQRWKTFVRL